MWSNRDLFLFLNSSVLLAPLTRGGLQSSNHPRQELERTTPAVALYFCVEIWPQKRKVWALRARCERRSVVVIIIIIKFMILIIMVSAAIIITHVCIHALARPQTAACESLKVYVGISESMYMYVHVCTCMFLYAHVCTCKYMHARTR